MGEEEGVGMNPRVPRGLFPLRGFSMTYQALLTQCVDIFLRSTGIKSLVGLLNAAMSLTCMMP